MKAEFDTNLKNALAEQNNKITIKSLELEASLQLKFDDYSLATKKAVAEDLVDQLTELQKQIDRINQENFTKKMKERIASISSGGSGSQSIGLTHAIDVLRTCHKRLPGEVSNLLHIMLKLIDEGGRLTAAEITETNEVLDQLPNQYKTLSDRLKSKLLDSEIFDLGRP